MHLTCPISSLFSRSPPGRKAMDRVKKNKRKAESKLLYLICCLSPSEQKHFFLFFGITNNNNLSRPKSFLFIYSLSQLLLTLSPLIWISLTDLHFVSITISFSTKKTRNHLKSTTKFTSLMTCEPRKPEMSYEIVPRCPQLIILLTATLHPSIDRISDS